MRSFFMCVCVRERERERERYIQLAPLSLQIGEFTSVRMKDDYEYEEAMLMLCTSV